MPNTPLVCLLAGASVAICLTPAVAAEPPASVVRVYCNGRAGAGVVYGDGRHVLTAFTTVRSGRAVEIELADGRSVEAETVTVDREHGLALVELAAAVAAAPVEPRTQAVSLASPVYALFPAEESGRAARLPAARVTAAVAAIGEDALRVAVATPDDGLGAPIMDDAGRLVGLVVQPGPIAEVAPVGRGARLFKAAEADPEADYRGESTLSLRAGWLMRADGDGVSHGPRLSMDLVALDRFGLTARIGTLFGDAPGGDPAGLVGADTVGMVADIELNGRFGITPSAPLQIVGGLGMTRIHWSSRGHVLDGEDLVDARVDDDLLRPYARVGLGITDMVELGYSFELDTADPGRSAHRFGLTIGF